MVEVRWTKNALDDLDDIASYIAKDSAKYAKIFVNRILEMANHLDQFPKLGRKVPEYNDPDIREILYKNYRIIYLIKEEWLEIISVFHSSRKLRL
ncbi:MAG: type II toxin-antitoxin system RelE/ParE family toxin [Promethearchaeota archaeon]|nr:MAG: type II toxin-antitoxin system RelE/ParE family toxin [Candidatus Lokiarchaeota archaeon]